MRRLATRTRERDVTSPDDTRMTIRPAFGQVMIRTGTDLAAGVFDGPS